MFFKNIENILVKDIKLFWVWGDFIFDFCVDVKCLEKKL